MLTLEPLRFRPLFKRAIWGGRRLATLLNKPLGEGDDFAESWELVDHGESQSIVEFGRFAGATLTDLMRDQHADLLGWHAGPARFPLLFKFLDCNRELSVQVHPNDTYAARLDPPDLGKTEAWIVLHAEPDSRIYAGLKRGMDRPAVAREVNRGTVELCLHWFQPQVGDCVFIPAGTPHALGGGLVIAEIQQASDTTFRLFDWNRLGPDGQPRPLHVEQSLDVIDYARGPVAPQEPQPTELPHVERLVMCDKFILDRWRFSEPQTIGGDYRFHILAVLDGEVHVERDPADRPLLRGQTILIPASCEPLTLTPASPAVMLAMYLPEWFHAS